MVETVSSQANLDQARASDPGVSAWVSANAGSGKTHVLVNRVIRLMLTGTPPEKILCLTYTRAAAAEMSNRLYERLAEWIPLDDDALIEKIHQNTGHSRFTKQQLAAPRRLFAQALETPGGLKIQTIHAFCVQLLHRFPLEAGVTAGFSVMDDRQAAELLVKIRSDFLASIDDSEGNETQHHLSNLIKFNANQKTFDDLLASILGRRNELEIVYEDLQAASCRLAKALGIGVNDTFESLVTESKAGWNLTALETAKKVLASQPGSTNQTTSMLLDRLLKTDKASDVFDVLFKITHTAKGTMKTDRSLCSPKCAKEFPDTLQALQELAVSASQLIEKINAVKILKTTESAMYVGKIITQEYDAEKNRLGVYDYQDLISKVLGMFSRMPDAAWVLYKLDGGLDHILIDEAQDTSPAQWDIIQFLADDFFTGAGARPDILRSIFAVGDRKQSIYSFQGAAPESFDLRHRYFRQVVRQCGLKFESVDFEVSFRSTSPVLELVDEVFAQAIAAEGVDKTIHSAQRATAPGLVELWPLEEKASTEKHSAWVPHSNPASESQAQVRLAQKIARKIRLWLDSGERLHSVDRAVRPGDILILVRKRTLFMAALVRALKLAGVPVAGVDRLLLTRHIAVQDMLALAQFVLTPQDDLNFAGLLKSTLLSRNDGSPFDDDDLIFISTNRGDKSLWAAFLDASENSDFYSNARSELERWRDLAGQVPPFEFFSGVLITDQKRRNILKRLGSEAGEPIDAFLALAMQYEQNNVATLQGFSSWVEADESEIKRQMEEANDEVRIMTVHGAKGLEANIVILPDTFSVADNQKPPWLLSVGDDTPVLQLKSSLETKFVKTLKLKYLAETLEEQNRLLYVAMTRARDRLYVGAAEPGKGALQPGSWYQLVMNVLGKEAFQISDPVFGEVWQISNYKDQVAEKHDNDPLEIRNQNQTLPVWATTSPQKEKRALEWIGPSRLGLDEGNEADFSLSPLAGGSENRFKRGNLIHKLLQYLPDVELDERRQAAETFVSVHANDLSRQEQTATLCEVFAVLENDRFAGVFAPGSVAEAPVVAEIRTSSGQNLVLNGQIDRLCVGEDEILIVDYKTNKPPPASLKDVNQQYVRQMAGYALALQEIYPDRVIRAGLLWTYNATLMEIDQKRLDQAFSD